MNNFNKDFKGKYSKPKTDLSTGKFDLFSNTKSSTLQDQLHLETSERPKFKSDKQDEYQGKRFKRSTVIIEEEYIFKKKIISIFEEGEIYEKSQQSNGKCFTTNNENVSTKISKNLNCFQACFKFIKHKPVVISIPVVTPNPQVISKPEESKRRVNWYDQSDLLFEEEILPVKEEYLNYVDQSNSISLDHSKNDLKREISNAEEDKTDIDRSLQPPRKSEIEKKQREKKSNERSENLSRKDDTSRIEQIKTEKSHSMKQSTEKEISSRSRKEKQTKQKEKIKKKVEDIELFSKKESDLNNEEEELFMKQLKELPIRNRYMFQSLLGEGTFGKVISCVDSKSANDTIAIKVNKKIAKYRRLAKHELFLLTKIKENDPEGMNFVVILKDWFEIDLHILFVFPQYGDDLYTYLRSINHRGMKLGDVRHISCQMWRAVNFLHKLDIVHTDIKPENLLFVTREYKYVNIRDSTKKLKVPISHDIVLIDIGNGICGTEYKPKTIVTRYYRPPEVYLELEWDKSVDIWSMGCVMFELYAGKSLFQCHADRDHLWMMQYLLGDFPQSLIRQSKLRDVFFDETGHVFEENLNLEKLKKVFRHYEYLLQHKSDNETRMLDLIHRCLKYEPSDRISTKRALRLSFLSLD